MHLLMAIFPCLHGLASGFPLSSSDQGNLLRSLQQSFLNYRVYIVSFYLLVDLISPCFNHLCDRAFALV